MKIVLRIRRFHPETDPAPHDGEYPLDVEPTSTILDALIRVKNEQDGSLSFRRSCGHGVCGSDAMVIGGVERLACKTLVREVATEENAVISVEPLKHLPVQNDLMVDQAEFFKRLPLGGPVPDQRRSSRWTGARPKPVPARRLRRYDQLHPLRRLLFRVPGFREELLVPGAGRPRQRSPVPVRQS